MKRACEGWAVEALRLPGYLDGLGENIIFLMKFPTAINCQRLRRIGILSEQYQFSLRQPPMQYSTPANHHAILNKPKFLPHYNTECPDTHLVKCWIVQDILPYLNANLNGYTAISMPCPILYLHILGHQMKPWSQLLREISLGFLNMTQMSSLVSLECQYQQIWPD